MVDNSLGDADYYDKKDYAGLCTRLLVMLVDAIALLLIGLVLAIPFIALQLVALRQSVPMGYFWLLYLLAIWAYLAPLKRSSIGTLGYRLLGVKLVSAKGGPPSLFVMTARMFIWRYGPFIPLFDLLWLGLDTESRTLRDCYLGTYMVKRDAQPIGRAPLHLTRYHAGGFALSYPRVCRPQQHS